MCSLDKGDISCEIANGVISGKNSDLLNALCKKCRQEGKVVLEKRHVYCRDCFLIMSSHKFRSLIGKYKLITSTDNVMIIFSGNFASVSLLNLIRCALENTSHRKLSFTPFIVYVDAQVFASTTERRKATLMKIKNLLDHYDYRSYYISLEAVLDTDVTSHLKKFDEFNDSDCYNVDSMLNDKIKYVLQSKSYSEEELFTLFSNNLWLKIANVLGCNKIFTTDNSDSLAVRALNCIAIGRGYHLPFNMAVCNDKNSHVKVMRPLREFTLKELAFYAVFNKLDFISVLPGQELVTLKPSIQRLVESFVVGLQDKFPATVHTICHTGDKLKMSTAADSADEIICVLCKLPVDVNEKSDSSGNIQSGIAFDNDKFSVLKLSDTDDGNAKFDILNAITDLTIDLGSDVVIKRLCYACRRIYEDMRK